jgi:NAD-dependent deacetylase
VLWFDEYYEEPLYRSDSAIAATRAAAVLVVVGTSGATALPAHLCEIIAARGAPLVVVDPAPTSFSALALRTPRGVFLRGTAGAIVPALATELTGS